MSKIIIEEVCPRDGWQNFKGEILDHNWKVETVKKMIGYGARKIDLASFVNPKYVPQMADAKDMFNDLIPWVKEQGLEDVELMALTLNSRGVEDAIKAGAKTVMFVASASEEHNLRNSKKSISESLEDLAGLYEKNIKGSGVEVQLSIACAFASPFGDTVEYSTLKKLIETGKNLGIKKFGLADTAGIADPMTVRASLKKIKEDFGLEGFSMHMHDARGMGLANVLVGLEEGITTFDSSLAGMGGCPFVPGAKGNIATEDLLNMLESMGYETGYDLDKVLEAANEMDLSINANANTNLLNIYRCSKKD